MKMILRENDRKCHAKAIRLFGSAFRMLDMERLKGNLLFTVVQREGKCRKCGTALQSQVGNQLPLIKD